MSDIFDKSTHNVLDDVNTKGSFAEDFEGDLFNGAESNFLGIAIGKKAKARKAAKRDDRQSARKYKLETERIRALQGQERQNAIKDIGDGLGKVASAVVPFLVPGGGAASVLGGIGGSLGGDGGESGNFDEAYPQNQQPDSYPQPAPKSNNTILYAIIAVMVVFGAVILMKK